MNGRHIWTDSSGARKFACGDWVRAPNFPDLVSHTLRHRTAEEGRRQPWERKHVPSTLCQQGCCQDSAQGPLEMGYSDGTGQWS